MLAKSEDTQNQAHLKRAFETEKTASAENSTYCLTRLLAWRPSRLPRLLPLRRLLALPVEEEPLADSLPDDDPLDPLLLPLPLLLLLLLLPLAELSAGLARPSLSALARLPLCLSSSRLSARDRRAGGGDRR